MAARFARVLAVLAWLPALLVWLPSPGLAQTNVFGPETFVRGTGAPQAVARSFSATPGGAFTLEVTSGPNGTPRVSSATIRLNGHVVVRPQHFNKQVTQIVEPVRLLADNRLTVEIAGTPGSALALRIVGQGPALPPDPGAAGKATLEGIDSDGDGVRDDIQRYIALTYPDSRKARLALTTFAITQQDALRDAGDKSASINHARRQDRALECLWFLRGYDSRQLWKPLLAQVLNTELRTRAYIAYNRQLAGQVFVGTPEASLKTACTFDPDQVEN